MGVLPRKFKQFQFRQNLLIEYKLYIHLIYANNFFKCIISYWGRLLKRHLHWFYLITYNIKLACTWCFLAQQKSCPGLCIDKWWNKIIGLFANSKIFSSESETYFEEKWIFSNPESLRENWLALTRKLLKFNGRKKKRDKEISSFIRAFELW